MADLVHELIFRAAERTPESEALACDGRRLSYAQLANQTRVVAQGLLNLGLCSGERAAVYLEKRIETAVALFGIAAAGAAFIPVNPLLKPHQVTHILGDCNVRILVTSTVRYASLVPLLSQCPGLHTVILVDETETVSDSSTRPRILHWGALTSAASSKHPHRRIGGDVAAILYTSGSTGKPKGVVLSHQNLVTGAQSVSTYLRNTSDDRLLAALPLSFDYGLSQLTTAFCVGGCAVLANYLFPKDLVRMVAEERITGLAGVPPLWHQLAHQAWPKDIALRYVTNSGGMMPTATLNMLRSVIPDAEIYLMYGLTEAFRSTYLPPSELARRSNSIGRPIPNVDVMVVREDGTLCEAYEHGELVHRGPLVSLGYWNDPDKTAERFRPLPQQEKGLPIPEIAVWSGDTVYRDENGYLYFVGRRDEMIKVSGYRISPGEIEEVLMSAHGVAEVVAVGVPHPSLGQAIIAVIYSSDETLTASALLRECKQMLPAYMMPAHIDIRGESLPRNPNGKLDRSSIRASLRDFFASESNS